MQFASINGHTMHYSDTGPRDGIPIVFSNSLGTDFRIWNGVVDRLPDSFRVIRYDTCGHGLSDGREGPYFMGDLVADAASLIDHLDIRNVVFVGLSIGGLIAQGLAAERPELLRAMVLCDTAAKIGTTDLWHDRIAMVKEKGIAGMSEAILERWFPKTFQQQNPEALSLYRNMLVRTSPGGYIGCSHAISETDLLESTSGLTVPTLAMVGREDGATPPDLVRETAELIPGAEFEIIPKCGHLPCLDDPQAVRDLIISFLERKKLI